MSALAHYLEGEGLATVMVSLVRHQSDVMCPPRVLWVPFELGRPLGEPGDAAFQRGVLEALLGLLDEPAGPVLHEYPRDAPSSQDDPTWRGPDLSACGSLAGEFEALMPLHAHWLAEYGRSTVGVSGLGPHARIDFLEGFPDAPRPPPLAAFSDRARLRFVADDHKAYYTEAASAGDGRPSSRQLDGWLWKHTRLGARLQALREQGSASDDAGFVTVASRFLVPVDWR